MKIYNKKGLLWGVLWTGLGVIRLITLVIRPEDTTAQFVKELLLGLAFVAFGLTWFLRAFSKEATREDKYIENDEREQLVRLKSKARMNDVMFGLIIAMIVIGTLGYYLMENIAWAFLVFVPMLQLIAYFWGSIILAVYYERKE